MLYKVGQKVRIVNKRGEHWNRQGKMDKYMGKVMTISKVVQSTYSTKYTLEDAIGDKGYKWLWREEDFIPLDCICGDDYVRR